MQKFTINKFLASLAILFAVAVFMIGCTNTESPNTESPNTESPNTESPNTESPNTESPNTESPTTSNIENIIDEHIEAVGGASAIQKIKTIRKFNTTTSFAPTGNDTGTVESMFDLIADRGRIDLDMGLYKESKGWIGQKGWKLSSFEPLRDLTAEELPIEKIAAPVSIIFTLKDQLGRSVFLPPVASQFDGQDCIKVKIVGSPLELYVNNKTKLVAGIEIPHLMKITLSNYKKVSGVQISYKSKVEIFVANSTFTSELKKIEFNGKINADEFSKPDN